MSTERNKAIGQWMRNFFQGFNNSGLAARTLTSSEDAIDPMFYMIEQELISQAMTDGAFIKHEEYFSHNNNKFFTKELADIVFDALKKDGQSWEKIQFKNTALFLMFDQAGQHLLGILLPEGNKCQLAIQDLYFPAADNILKSCLPNTHLRATEHCGSSNRVRIRAVYIDKNRVAPDCFFPFIPDTVGELFRDFMDGDSSVLILIGPPGTGKSSFVRNLILKHELAAHITSSIEIMRDGAIFQTSAAKRNSLVVLEDADKYIESRADHGNQYMSSLLNFSEGIMSSDNCKIVITTNLHSLKDVDEALLRPGRCYGVIQFRPLSYEEAQIVQEVTGKKDTQLVKGNSYTLADTLNTSKQINLLTKNKSGFGFTVGQ